MVEESLGDWSLNRDLALTEVCLRFCNDCIYHLLVHALVEQTHLVHDLNLVAADL